MVVPWLIWTVAVAAINLTLLIAIRGRWGRMTAALALAALAGTAAGNALADLAGVELLVLGEFHLLGATVGAQLAMVVILALAALLRAPGSSSAGRDGAGRGR